jgi:hypothetical protein
MLSVLILLALFSQASSAVQVEKLPTFQQYRVAQIYRGKAAEPVFTTKEEREFRTQICRQAAKGPNFAGHYTVVTWGCGTQCTSFVIVDARTGRIFSHAQRENAAWPFCNLDSRLMVTDDDCRGAEENCHRSFWDWTGTELKFITKIPIDFRAGPPRGFVTQ